MSSQNFDTADTGEKRRRDAGATKGLGALEGRRFFWAARKLAEELFLEVIRTRGIFFRRFVRARII